MNNTSDPRDAHEQSLDFSFGSDIEVAIRKVCLKVLHIVIAAQYQNMFVTVVLLVCVKITDVNF